MNQVIRKFMDKPVLSGIVITLMALLSLKVMAAIPTSSAVMDILKRLVFIGLWIAVYIWFRKEFKDEIPHTESFGTIFGGLRFLWPTLVIALISLAAFAVSFALGDVKGLTPMYVADALTEALVAGVFEEIALRGLFTANMIRVNNSSKAIYLNAFIPAFAFGFAHITNIMAGAGVYSTIGQILSATGTGFMLSAAFFRTGTIVPGIITHTFGDLCAFLSLAVNNGTDAQIGLLVDNTPPLQIILNGAVGFTIFAVYALFLLRKKKQPEICRIFRLDTKEKK